jgi:hypothetical protein
MKEQPQTRSSRPTLVDQPIFDHEHDTDPYGLDELPFDDPDESTEVVPMSEMEQNQQP